MKLALVAIAWASIGAATADDLWNNYGHLAKPYPAIAPTPAGKGHLGKLASGATVQIRFPLPKTRPVGLWAGLSNIVGYTGKGTSYQLVLRVDSKTGPVIYEGPVIANGDKWNASNRKPIPLTKVITDAHVRQGYIDIFATGIVQRDGWTLYRHNKARQIVAQVAVLSEKELAQLRTANALAAKGMALLPMPQQIALADGDFACTNATRIVVAPHASKSVRFAAHELAIAIKEAGIDAPVVATAKAEPSRDIVLELRAGSVDKAQGYRIEVDANHAHAVAGDESGLFYAAQTLRQLVTKVGDKAVIAGATIHDWPAFPIRGFQYDIARGQTVDVEFCKHVIRESARVKMNAIMFYMEDDYKFEKFPFLGREGTFTKAKAQELTVFARRYHLQLIPQYESLGHASAVLRHNEMVKMREKGGSWVFCTSAPETWQFLDDAYAELAEAFGNSKFIHVGGDEFESGFAKCDRCKAKAAKIGVGGLYAEHMNKLDALVKKHGRRMLFWPSHGGPSEDFSYMSLKNAAAMPKDAVPTEWIYHGPSSYPQIEQYQKAGYRDVWCSPAVVGYSRPYPDYRTTFRGVSGFFRAGHERHCQAAMTTTWEFMHGALFENAWMGLIYTAECAWSLGISSQADFERRFVQHWFGITKPDAWKRLADLLYSPMPVSGNAAIWRNSKTMCRLLWCAPKKARKQFVQKGAVPPDRAAAVVTASAQAINGFEALLPLAKRQQCTIRFAIAACQMYGYACDKLIVLGKVADLYAAASNAQAPAQAAPSLEQAAAAIDGILPQCDALAASFKTAIERFGGYKGDLRRMKKQKTQWQDLAKDMRKLASDLQAGKIAKLPPAGNFGLGSERYIKVAAWSPDMMSEKRIELTWPLKGLPATALPITIEFEYTRGAHGLRIYRASLVVDDKEVSVDEHTGWAGGGSHNNRYKLQLPAHGANAKVELGAAVASSGGTNSRGDVWVVVE